MSHHRDETDGGAGLAGPQVEGELTQSSLVELVASRLRQDIVSGALAPGERIVEEQLTRRFGTSRAPLREALRLLSQQGLVEHSPRRGVRVATLSETDADELFELRHTLEELAIRKALRRAGQVDLGELDATLAALAAAAEADDAPRAAAAHHRFHLALVGLAGQRQLLLTYEPVLARLQLYMAANLRREAQQTAPAEGVLRHRRLRDAIASGDEAAALHELAGHGERSFFR
ncbi:MAG TPA: GntR family transcriptional regulator [Mycobacteriales bacterium]|nr:GntR family transcriptional regulator [Mycobacteriales bacterium]